MRSPRVQFLKMVQSSGIKKSSRERPRCSLSKFNRKEKTTGTMARWKKCHLGKSEELGVKAQKKAQMKTRGQMGKTGHFSPRNREKETETEGGTSVSYDVEGKSFMEKGTGGFGNQQRTLKASAKNCCFETTCYLSGSLHCKLYHESGY